MLGELALKTADLAGMKAFYNEVIGFEVFNDEFDFFVFLKVGEGVEGHPQILGIFDRSTEVAQPMSTLDHFAFVTDLDGLHAMRQRLESHDVAIFPKEFPHFGWRSIFFYDPDGNTVEFVAYDSSSP